MLEESIHGLPTSSSPRRQWMSRLDNLTMQFDSISSKLREEQPEFDLNEVVEEPDNPDELSTPSTCATPTVPADFQLTRRPPATSDRNFALNFFKVELDNFDAFLSVHENTVADAIRNAPMAEELEGAQSQLENYQVCCFKASFPTIFCVISLMKQTIKIEDM